MERIKWFHWASKNSFSKGEGAGCSLLKGGLVCALVPTLVVDLEFDLEMSF